MSSERINCCIKCGSDTTQKSQICKRCYRGVSVYIPNRSEDSDNLDKSQDTNSPFYDEEWIGCDSQYWGVDTSGFQ